MDAADDSPTSGRFFIPAMESLDVLDYSAGSSGDQLGVPGLRSPGGAALHCWDGGAAPPASSRTADGCHATKFNHFLQRFVARSCNDRRASG